MTLQAERTTKPVRRREGSTRMAIYDYIVSFSNQYGFPPTIREIGEAMGLSSSGTVSAHLRRLEQDHMIERYANHARAIRRARCKAERMLFYTTIRRQKEATRMRLPRSLHNRILYMLLRTKEIRSGKFPADPRWLTCIERTSQNVPREEMRAFFEQYFVQNLSCDEIQYNLYIERSTLFNWRDYFLWHAALEAAALGLITERDGFLCA